MPELPEVETVCRTLRRPLVGQAIETAAVHWARTIEPHSPPAFVSGVAGREIKTIFRRAKLIVFHLSGDMFLTTHLRMTGKLLYRSPEGEPVREPDSHLRVGFTLRGGGRLDFFDARKFGRIQLLSHPEWRARSAEFGPEPLDPELTPDHFHAMLQRRSRQIKPLLLDQTFIAGIGNIYADEALFQARIHPLQVSSSISKGKAFNLHGAIVNTLRAAIANEGTTLRDYRSGLGNEGSNQSNLLVYGAKPGSRCLRCGTMLKRLVVGQRGSTICARCQRLP